MERDFIINQFAQVIIISTHTLTWSVTLQAYALSKGIMISTHTLTWSVTNVVTWCDRYNAFQLTRSRGA